MTLCWQQVSRGTFIVGESEPLDLPAESLKWRPGGGEGRDVATGGMGLA
jgi:hypothetical protein